MQAENHINSLRKGYILHWYEIKSIIGRGGFGITYLAYDKNLDRNVAIKEFMPEDFAVRESDSTVHPKTGQQKKLYEWGLERFIKEAQTLAKFNHHNIIHVQSVFEQNNTAYMVMEYAQGEDLSSIYKKRTTFSEEQFLDIFIPIMDGLSLVHEAGFIHRDIKPANIFICDDDLPILLDFGSARQSIGGKTKALTSLVTYGYAPYEQYNEGTGKQGPWTDIYSLGACIYVGITGQKPVNALQRGGSFLESNVDAYQPVSQIAKGKYSKNFLLAVDNALMFKSKDRPQNILDWANMLLGKTQAPELPRNMFSSPEDKEYTTTELLQTPNQNAITSPSKRGQGLIDTHGKRNTQDTRSKEGTQLFKPAESFSAPSRNHLDRNTNRKSRPQLKTKKPWLTITLGSITLVISLISLNWYFNHSSAPDSSTDISQELQSQDKKSEQNIQQQRQQQIEQLLTKAEQQFAQNNFVGPKNNNALYFYQQILKIDLNNEKASKGIGTIEKRLYDDANAAFKNEKYDISLDYLAQLKYVNPDSKNAEVLTNKVNQKQTQQSQITLWLESATKQINQKRYTNPTSDNAFDTYKKILQLDSKNQQALTGLKNIERHYKTQFKHHISTLQLTKAGTDISIMKKIGAPQSTIREMQSDLKNSKQKQVTEKKTQELHQKIKVSKVKQTTTNKVNIQVASQIVEQYKHSIENRNKTQLKSVSQFKPGRKQFVDQLFNQYKKVNVRITRFQLIPKENKAQAKIELTDLVDKNDVMVTAGGWNKFEIIVQYNKNNQLKVHW